jgi:hypothetical protein
MSKKITDKLDALRAHPFYKSYFKKFRKEDYDYMESFLKELEQMTEEQRVRAVYRSAMRENKPKNWTAIEELLSIAIK